MMQFDTSIPLSLYIHTPWCIQKCPYCDFNSHAQKGPLPEVAYVDALIQELDEHLPLIWGRRLSSIFIGGGTPSLLSAQAYDRLFSAIQARLPYTQALEITLEANPGTVEAQRFIDYRQIGINRLSLGIQSFNDSHLKKLGRIHDGNAAKNAIDIAKCAGFDNLNLDIMFALPHQTLAQALEDIQTAIDFTPQHISWYQLTIEPNTLFHHQKPPLPDDELSWEIQTQGLQHLAAHGFRRYEVSAYSQLNRTCAHNKNYWTFGDYLGIGAGAHSKITLMDKQHIIRQWNRKNPRDYLDPKQSFVENNIVLSEDALPFEFMLNVLRLSDGVKTTLFKERTGLSIDTIAPLIRQAIDKGLLLQHPDIIKPTELGERFLNDLVSLFLHATW